MDGHMELTQAAAGIIRGLPAGHSGVLITYLDRGDEVVSFCRFPGCAGGPAPRRSGEGLPHGRAGGLITCRSGVDGVVAYYTF